MHKQDFFPPFLFHWPSTGLVSLEISLLHADSPITCRMCIPFFLVTYLNVPASEKHISQHSSVTRHREGGYRENKGLHNKLLMLINIKKTHNSLRCSQSKGDVLLQKIRDSRFHHLNENQLLSFTAAHGEWATGSYGLQEMSIFPCLTATQFNEKYHSNLHSSGAQFSHLKNESTELVSLQMFSSS